MDPGSLHQVGLTTDGKPSMAGIFHYRATLGLSLSSIIDALAAEGMVVSWLHYTMEALLEGQKHRLIKGQVVEALVEVHGPKDKKHFEDSMDKILAFLEPEQKPT